MTAVDAGLEARASDLRELASTVAGVLASRATSTTTLACERAVLRMCGVSGLSGSGRPLAHEVVERYAAGDSSRLGGGIGLPFAVATLEYDLDAQQLALEVADGHVDLAFESGVLRDDERRMEAERRLAGWLAAAQERFDANRTARHELISVLGEPPHPWIASELRAFDARDAARDAGFLVAAGADLLRVRVPRDGELRRGLGEATDEDQWPVGPTAPPPAGSQRGLAMLRDELDQAAVRHGRYPRLATRRIGLAAPEQAVVAGFERVDAVFSDPMDAIFELGIDPVRAFADHAWAQSLVARTGCDLVLGPGPFVAPELARGVTPAPAVRAGRALALQALSLAFALRNGVPADRISVGAVPSAAFAGSGAGPRVLAEVALRGLMFPGHGLVVDEQASDAADEGLASSVVAWLSGDARLRTVFSSAPPPYFEAACRGLRAGVDVARWLTQGRSIGGLRGAALDHAEATLAAALAALREIATAGLDVLLAGDAAAHVGAQGVVPRRGAATGVDAQVAGAGPGPDAGGEAGAEPR
jgi:hypothetical protein